MLRKSSVLWLAGFVLLLGTLACECDNGGSLTETVPRLARHYVGQQDVAPAPGDYTDVPASGEIALAFGLTDVDIVNSRFLFLQNTGTGVLHMAGLTVADGTSSDFAVACLEAGQFRLDCPYDDTHTLDVPAGQDLVLRVSYSPRDVGTDAGSFVIRTDARDHPALTVTLTGEGVTPEIQVCVSDCTGDQGGASCAGAQLVCNDGVAPASLSVDFGDTDMATAVGRDLLIRNLGDRPLEVKGLVFISGAHSQYDLEVTGGVSLPGILPAGEEAVVRLVFDPGLGGEHLATLQVQSNDVNEREINVVLSGRGLAPRVCPEPMALDFGNVPTGQSLEQSFVITNCGLLELQLEGLALSASTSADFSLTANPAPTALAPGAQTTVTVRYYPQTQGSDRGGVDIFSNDPASDPASHLTGAVSLIGQSVPRQCQIQATPFAVTFGGVVQQESATVNVVISNQGSDTCTLQSVQITANSADNEFALDQAPPADSQIQPGDSLVALVRYSPVNLGVDTGTLSLFGNDANGNEVRVDLNGEGVQSAACDLEINPTSLNFGTVKVNTTATQVVQLTNVGQAMCNISQLELKQSAMFPGNFTITAGPSVPFVLNRRNQPNSQASVEITYAPDTVSQDEVIKQSAALRVTSDDPDLQLSGGSMFDIWACLPPPTLGQACIPMSGMSVESAIEVVPSELDFGVVQVGCNSPELHVTVYNLGTEQLNITDLYLETQPDPNFEIRQAPALPYNLTGGGSFQVRLRYHPQEDRAHRNNLIIVSDASNAQMLAVPLFGRGTLLSHQTDVFHQPTDVKSDVLFVVDNSGSMGWAQQALADNFASFIAYATSLQVDYHIGVITTEVQAAETGLGDPPRDIIPGVLVQAPNRPKIITNQTPDLNAAFSDNVNVGTCCSDEQESGLQAAHMALTDPLLSDPTANAGFLREDAKLYLIMLSDEQDQSRGDPDFYVDFFQSIKGYRNTDMMKMSAICGDAPDGCPDPQNPTAGSGSRYIDVANRTGGIFESICTANWAQSLQNLGIDAFASIREFPLSRPADAGTLTVTVDGVVVPPCGTAGCADGYTYYPDTNSIYFGDGIVPGRGARVEVDYEAVCL
jgi:hypothetical protein